MPSKYKRSHKTYKVVQKPLSTSDLYLFKKTFLDSDQIGKMVSLSEGLLSNSMIINSDLSTKIQQLEVKLANNKFNNVYGYLDALIEVFGHDKQKLEILHSLIEDQFSKAECTKLINMYTTTELYDV